MLNDVLLDLLLGRRVFLLSVHRHHLLVLVALRYAVDAGLYVVGRRIDRVHGCFDSWRHIDREVDLVGLRFLKDPRLVRQMFIRTAYEVESLAKLRILQANLANSQRCKETVDIEQAVIVIVFLLQIPNDQSRMLLKCKVNRLQDLTLLGSLGFGAINQVIESSQINILAHFKIADKFLRIRVIDSALSDQYRQ